MISEVVMPQMGADMEEGTIIKWLKNEGDEVERGEIIAEIETDKANVEIEAFDPGVFRKALHAEGDTIDVGTVIAIIAAPDDDISSYENGASKQEAPKAEAAPEPAAEPPETEVVAAVPVAEPPAPTATPVSKDNGRVRASPVARKFALNNNVDLSTLSGTGPDGRIVKRDVEAALTGDVKPQAAPAAAAGTTTTISMVMTRSTLRVLILTELKLLWPASIGHQKPKPLRRIYAWSLISTAPLTLSPVFTTVMKT